MLLLLRWATPTLLVFADTAILYSLVASLFSFMLAHHRGVYHAHSWSATVRNLVRVRVRVWMSVRVRVTALLVRHGAQPGPLTPPLSPTLAPAFARRSTPPLPRPAPYPKTNPNNPHQVRNLAVSVAQFNTKVLAPRGVALLTHEPLWYLQEGVQRDAPSLEACSTQWRAFATAWNSIVKALRKSDLLSTNEHDELLFVELRGPQVMQAFGAEVYVLFPTMLTSPVFSRPKQDSQQSP